MKKLTHIFIITMLLMVISNTIAVAQSESLQLSVIRIRGYSGSNDDIQGYFTFSVREQEGLQSVQFFLDGDMVLEINEPPFKFKLNSDNYENGVHTLNGLGIFSDGRRISSTSFTREFVSHKSLHLPRGLGVAFIIMIVFIVLLYRIRTKETN
jgi:hypothetical protein